MKTSIKSLLLAGAVVGLVGAGCSSSGGGSSGNTTATTGSTTGTGGMDLGGQDIGDLSVPVDLTVINTVDSGPIPDAALPPLVDIGAPVAPSVTLVSTPTVAAGLVTSPDGLHALYLASPRPAALPQFSMMGTQTTSGNPVEGSLHMVDTSGHDTVIVQAGTKAAVPLGGYQFTPDGKKIMYEVLPFTGSSSKTLALSASLVVASVATPTTGAVTVLPSGVDVGPPLTNNTGIGGGFWAGVSTTNFVMGVNDQDLDASESMVIINLDTPKVVYEVQNGTFGYQEVAASDTLYYQALAGGTTTTSPPVQTLYSVPLTGATGATATAVTTHTATILAVSLSPASTTPNTLVWLTTTGDVFSQPLNASGALTGTAKQLTPPGSPVPAPPVATAITAGDSGFVAYVGGDGSLHVQNATGVEIYKTAAKTVDLFSPIAFTGDNNGSLYFFKYVKSQELRGILYYADLSSASGPASTVSTPVAVYGTATGLNDPNYDENATYLYSVTPQGGGSFLAQNNLPAAGQAFVEPLFAPLVLSGGNTPIAHGVPAGEFKAGFVEALLFNGTVDPSANQRITGQATYGGNLGITDLAAPATSVLPAAAQTDIVSAGNYEWSDGEGTTLLYIEQVVAGTTPAFNTIAQNYAGTLHVDDVGGGTGNHTVTFNGTVASDQVTELGPVTKRTAFLIACDPNSAAAQGVYFLTY